MSNFLTLDEIEAQAQVDKGGKHAEFDITSDDAKVIGKIQTVDSDEKPMAFYSMNCCWWTTRRHDLGEKPGTDMGALGSLPCCPHCYSVLHQAPLADYLKAARLNPDHYGAFGLEALAKAHAANTHGCAPLWRVYNFMLEVEKDLGVGAGWLAQVNLHGSGVVKIATKEEKTNAE